ncbi:hypothetical protein KRMM14A1259_45270 [Krasilnikovia sp. MM14-A1259]
MDADDFWTFIELSHRAGPKPGDREAFLAHRLSRISRSHLLDFVQHLSATREPANTYRLWRAADILMAGGCSTDGFHYFQMLARRARLHSVRASDRRPRQSRHGAGRTAAGVSPTAWQDDDYPTWESLGDCKKNGVTPDQGDA